MDKKETKVVNIYREAYDIYIGRAGKGKDGYFGNPFKRQPGDRSGSTLSNFRRYFYKRLKNDETYKSSILALKGKKMGCFCKPNPCHGDIIKEYLDQIE